MASGTKDKYNLATGGILQKLVKLSLPIMGGQFVQMAYNLADMFWLGKLGSEAVAASGTVGLFMWLAMALQNYGARGAEIGVAQNMGRGNPQAARGYAQSSIGVSVALGVFFGAFMLVFRTPLVGFFHIQEQSVVAATKSYLSIISIGVPFTYITATATGAFNGSGNSAVPFVINSFCLVINMVLDPLLIFTAGLGIAGAGIATIVAQILSALLMLLAIVKYRHPAFEGFRLFSLPQKQHVKDMARWATPIAIESFLFTFLIMIISRFVAGFGATAIAVQRVGSQIESLSWLIAGGFSMAFTAFIGQNYGARAFGRIRRGFYISTAVMAIWGVLITFILYFGSGSLVAIFLPGDTAAIEMGAQYLKILAFCQMLACLEGVSAGAFRGAGLTLVPSVVSVLCNIGRVLLAKTLSATALGVDGIWWALSIGAAARGLVLYLCCLVYLKRTPKKDEENPQKRQMQE